MPLLALVCFVIWIGSCVQSLVVPLASHSLLQSKWRLAAINQWVGDPPEGPPFPPTRGKRAVSLFGDPYFYHGDVELAKQDAAARQAFLGKATALDLLQSGNIKNSLPSAKIDLGRVRSYVNAYRVAYRSFYGPRSCEAPMEELDIVPKPVLASEPSTGELTKPALVDPSNTRAVTFLQINTFMMTTKMQWILFGCSYAVADLVTSQSLKYFGRSRARRTWRNTFVLRLTAGKMFLTTQTLYPL
jgi:hypothetical protein